MDMLDLRYVNTANNIITLLPGTFDITDIYSRLGSLFPSEVTVIFTTDDIRKKTKKPAIKALNFTDESFFLEFIRS